MTPKGRTRAVGYIRVSTDKQADGGASLEAQGAAIRAYCSLYAVDLVPVVLEGAEAEFAVDAGWSASTLERPALQATLAMMERGEVDAIVVAKLDRLTRSLDDLSTLVKAHFREEDGASLLSVTEQIDTRTAGGRLFVKLIILISEWEREVIGERTSAVMRYLCSQGRYMGGKTRFGRRRAGTMLEDDPREQATISAARALRASGLSLRAVGRELAGRGLSPRQGGAWAPTQVARMVA